MMWLGILFITFLFFLPALIAWTIAGRSKTRSQFISAQVVGWLDLILLAILFAWFAYHESHYKPDALDGLALFAGNAVIIIFLTILGPTVHFCLRKHLKNEDFSLKEGARELHIVQGVLILLGIIRMIYGFAHFNNLV